MVCKLARVSNSFCLSANEDEDDDDEMEVERKGDLILFAVKVRKEKRREATPVER